MKTLGAPLAVNIGFVWWAHSLATGCYSSPLTFASVMMRLWHRLAA
ncbi:MAG: hypothetical protein ACI82A_003077 [Candidatus Azotimanducaceae bacterium]|jgi:hypothetical protein